MQNPFLSEVHPPDVANQAAFWLVYHHDDILLQQLGDSYQLPNSIELAIPKTAIKRQHYLGRYQQTPCYAIQVADWQPTENTVFHPIRQVHTLLSDEDFFQIIIRGKQILFWEANSQFCGACGQVNRAHAKERAKECSACGLVSYPVVAPVMITLIWRENEILLARPANFIPGMYSILAGFSEPGETLEETVHREVMEEVGLTVKNLQYFGSQPWPFPSNLMLGFIAEYDSGEIILDYNELEDGRWFKLDALPTLPRPFSLSRKMIDWYLQGKHK